jgi:hypothetical protein
MVFAPEGTLTILLARPSRDYFIGCGILCFEPSAAH